MLKEKKRVSKGKSDFFIGGCCFFRGKNGLFLL